MVKRVTRVGVIDGSARKVGGRHRSIRSEMRNCSKGGCGMTVVSNIGVKPSDAAIVQTIIAMGGSLGLEVIAEGVETEAQRAFLERHGCTIYQGYLFGKPMPLAEFERVLTQVLPV